MKGGLLSLMAVVFTMAASLVYVRGRFWLVELSYKLTETRQIYSRLEQERQSLEVELATLRSPKRMEAISKQRLGLRADAAPRVVTVQQ